MFHVWSTLEIRLNIRVYFLFQIQSCFKVNRPVHSNQVAQTSMYLYTRSHIKALNFYSSYSFGFQTRNGAA